MNIIRNDEKLNELLVSEVVYEALCNEFHQCFDHKHASEEEIEDLKSKLKFLKQQEDDEMTVSSNPKKQLLLDELNR